MILNIGFQWCEHSFILFRPSRIKGENQSGVEEIYSWRSNQDRKVRDCLERLLISTQSYRVFQLVGLWIETDRNPNSISWRYFGTWPRRSGGWLRGEISRNYRSPINTFMRDVTAKTLGPQSVGNLHSVGNRIVFGVILLSLPIERVFYIRKCMSEAAFSVGHVYGRLRKDA